MWLTWDFPIKKIVMYRIVMEFVHDKIVVLLTLYGNNRKVTEYSLWTDWSKSDRWR